MSLLDRIGVDPDVVHGRPAIRGTHVHGRPAIRGTHVRVADILSLLAADATQAEILDDYPYLAADHIRAALTYAAAQADHTILIDS